MKSINFLYFYLYKTIGILSRFHWKCLNVFLILPYFLNSKYKYEKSLPTFKQPHITDYKNQPIITVLFWLYFSVITFFKRDSIFNAVDSHYKYDPALHLPFIFTRTHAWISLDSGTIRWSYRRKSHPEDCPRLHSRGPTDSKSSLYLIQKLLHP